MTEETKLPSLPKYIDVATNDISEKNNLTPIQRFICDNEPAGADDEPWRAQLQQALQEAFDVGLAAVELDRQQRGEAVAWQPIETAPKDGRTLLLGRFNSHGKWRTMRGQWMSEDYIAEHWEDPDSGAPGWFETAVEAEDIPNCWPIEPTHWQPLPAAPQPVKPVVNQSLTTEREAFETWAKRTCRRPGTHVGKSANGTYKDNRIAAKWAAWQARASLAQPTTQQSLQVAETVEWQDAQRIADLPEVDELLQGFAEDPTGDNGTMIVRAVMQATRQSAEPVKGEPSKSELLAAIQRYADERAGMTEARSAGLAVEVEREAADRTAQAYADLCALLARYQGAQPAESEEGEQ